MMHAGDSAGDYIIEREIGRGGMGIVYRARHAVDGSLVAVKVLLPDLDIQAKPVRRFLKEIDAVRAVEHPNVVRFVDTGLLAIGRPYVVFELLDGIPLASMIGPAHPLDTACVVELATQVANGLDAVHAKDVIHRDVSPANIILARQQADHAAAKIIDFGVARLRDSVVGISSDSVDLGSPSFRAPEQERDSGSVNGEADIYALAVTTFVLLSGGILPWGRGATADLLERKRLDPTPDLRVVFAGINDDQAEVFRVAMAREPRKRWASATRFADELRRASRVGSVSPKRLDELLTRSAVALASPVPARRALDPATRE